MIQSDFSVKLELQAKQKYNLLITIEANPKVVNFLNLGSGQYDVQYGVFDSMIC